MKSFVHQKDLKIKKGEFPTWQAFMLWKKKIEKNTKTWYTTWFTCNREGAQRLNSTGKKAMKNQGTSKMGNHSTASLKAVEFCESGKVAIEFCLGHVEHDNELGHLRI